MSQTRPNTAPPRPASWEAAQGPVGALAPEASERQVVAWAKLGSLFAAARQAGQMFGSHPCQAGPARTGDEAGPGNVSGEIPGVSGEPQEGTPRAPGNKAQLHTCQGQAVRPTEARPAVEGREVTESPGMS